MTNLRFAVPFAALTLFTCGCGTLSNLKGDSEVVSILAYSTYAQSAEGRREPTPFGGVSLDLRELKSAPAYAFDIPCSLVGDVVTLPVVLAATMNSPRTATAKSDSSTPAKPFESKSTHHEVPGREKIAACDTDSPAQIQQCALESPPR